MNTLRQRKRPSEGLRRWKGEWLRVHFLRDARVGNQGKPEREERIVSKVSDA